MFALLLGLGCTRSECSRPEYDRPECRVQAENELARGLSAEGVDVRFQAVGAADAQSWDALGRVENLSTGELYARVGTLGDFRISLETDQMVELLLVLDNVDPRIPELDGQVSQTGLRRELELVLMPGVTWVEGTLPETLCSGAFRLAAVGDIQTNPLQFRRIVEELHAEYDRSEAAGAPLLGVVLLGDISEHSLAEELQEVLDMLVSSPVPAAVLPGNHDVYNSRDAVFNRVVGPGNLSFDLCDAHLVLLDTGSGRLAPSVEGRLPELIESDQRFLVAGVHHPPIPGWTGAGWGDEVGASSLLAELASARADLLMAGHVHQRLEFDDGPIPEVIVGTAGADQVEVEPDYGFLRLDFQEALDWCFVPVPAAGGAGVSRPPPPDCSDTPR
ncbi:MAG: metallophosphoesterase [Myxococcota bacterium]|nr:metallophosphoesterase [Myxococcota bacterium]